jgi:site-specific recombinase XerD
MNMADSEQLCGLVGGLLAEMEKTRYSAGYVQQMRVSCTTLLEIAGQMGKSALDEELANAFINDSSSFRTGAFGKWRYLRHKRCFRFLQAYQAYQAGGRPDWYLSRCRTISEELKSPQFIAVYAAFISHIETDLNLKRNTVKGYARFVHYFLVYRETLGHRTVSEIQGRDAMMFIDVLCQEQYQPTSIGSQLPGLKLFFSMNEPTKHLLSTFPKAPKCKKGIIPVLEKIEHDAFLKYLGNSLLSARDRAICWLAFETGLRAVDMANLKIADIDWANDLISITQQKTAKPLELPLRATYGNAIAEYLLHERPQSDSPNLFIASSAPFKPLTSPNAYRSILLKAFRSAGIDKPGRICGTRFTRHNAASHMLKSGVPLYDISAVLGHYDPNSVDVYLATDERMMAECCLPLPATEGGSFYD